MKRPPWHRWHGVVLAVALLWLASWGPPAEAAATSPGSSGSAALIQTVWGGGSAGNTPAGNLTGQLGAASLSSPGSTAWMGSSAFCAANSNFLLVDSGHPSTVRSFSVQSATGLATHISGLAANLTCPPGAALSAWKAVVADSAANVWLVDAGCGNLVYYNYAAAAAGSSPFYLQFAMDPTKAVSLAMKRDNSYLYVAFNATIIRITPACTSGNGSLCGYRQSIVNNAVSPSNLTLSLDESLLYFLDVGGIFSFNPIRLPTAYPVSPARVVSTGVGQAIVNPTAIALAPYGAGLVVADYLPAGYSQIKYINLTANNNSVSTIGPNSAQSNCSSGSATYQNGLLGGPACFGLIQQILTGTGTLGGQLLFFEVNTGRIRALDWASKLMRTVVGGGPANNGFSNARNVPTGWATGFGAESALDTAMTALAWDPNLNVGVVAEPVSRFQPLSNTAAHHAACSSLTAFLCCSLMLFRHMATCAR